MHAVWLIRSLLPVGQISKYFVITSFLLNKEKRQQILSISKIRAKVPEQIGRQFEEHETWRKVWYLKTVNRRQIMSAQMALAVSNPDLTSTLQNICSIKFVEVGESRQSRLPYVCLLIKFA